MDPKDHIAAAMKNITPGIGAIEATRPDVGMGDREHVRAVNLLRRGQSIEFESKMLADEAATLDRTPGLRAAMRGHVPRSGRNRV